MALNALTLAVTKGIVGQPFISAVNGATYPNRVEVLNDGAPGFSYVNGIVRSASLPYPVSTLVLREWEPGVGIGYRDSRIDITAATDASLRAAYVGGSSPTPTPTPTPTLGTPTLSGSLTQGVAASGVTLSGLTDGSTVAFNISGLSVGSSGTTRTVSGTPASSGSLAVTEGLGGVQKTTTVGSVAASGGSSLPNPDLMILDGNSLSANAGSRALLGGATLLTSSLCSATGRPGFAAPLWGNRYLLDEGHQHGVGASSSEGIKERARVASMANLGNPAFNVTGLGNDKLFSIGSDGRKITSKPGKYVLISGFAGNDDGATNLPANDYAATLNNLATYVDELHAGGVNSIVMTEQPRGPGVQRMEAKTPSSGMWTATYPVGFVDGESFGAVGVVGQFADGVRPMTKVASNPGQDQYTITVAGNVATYTAGGTAPTKAWITYNGSTSGSLQGTRTHHRLYTEYVLSNAPNFVSSVTGRDYGIPGLQYNRPWVIVVDAWSPMVDSANQYQNALPGMLHSDELHTAQLGAFVSGKAAADKLATVFPTAQRRDQRPDRNNWYADRGTGATSSFSGQLPPTMRGAFTGGPVPMLISVNGNVIGKVDPTTGAITGTGIASGNYDYSTGNWSFTTTSNSVVPNNGVVAFEADVGNWDFTNMVPGTIGRNALLNPLLDMTPAQGSKLTSTTGVQSAFPSLSAGVVPYGWTLQHSSGTGLATAIANGTAFLSVITGQTDLDGFPMPMFECSGIVPTSTSVLQLVQAVNNPLNRLTADQRVMIGANIRHAKHGTLGRMYGTYGAGLEHVNTLTGTVSRQFPAATPATTPDTINVSGVAARANYGAQNLYIDDAILAKSQALGITPAAFMEMYNLAPMVDTTGMIYASASARFNVPYSADVPLSGRFGVSRMQLRTRADLTF